MSKSPNNRPPSNGLATPNRVFEDVEAARSQVPLMVGLMGPSGSGKTLSALRLATGIQRVQPGDIAVIDTESRRALHYAPKRGERPQPPRTFAFRHIPFGAPFSPLDYLAAIEHAISKGARTIVVDSMSHEHEGPGGVLEMHAIETARLAQLWRVSESKAQLSAWGPPKSQRRRMINSILQANANFIFCFRAKEKLKIVSGKDPEPRGFMPIAGEEFVYEMAVCALLLPNAGGVPTWQSNEIGERLMIKLPDAFRAMLLGQRGPLSEDIGEQMAHWAAGGEVVERDPEDYALPAAYGPRHGGKSLRQYTDQQVEFFASDPKGPQESRETARRCLDARLARAKALVQGVQGHDPETGEVIGDPDGFPTAEPSAEPRDEAREALAAANAAMSQGTKGAPEGDASRPE
jgi:energy-coupling factor transporter ATP-binding protein EcfA2